MADNSYVTPLFFLIAAIAFISVILLSAQTSYNDYGGDRLILADDTTLGESWETTGENWGALEGAIPNEGFLIIILPIILIAAFVAVRIVLSSLPNWLSGG